MKLVIFAFALILSSATVSAQFFAGYQPMTALGHFIQYTAQQFQNSNRPSIFQGGFWNRFPNSRPQTQATPMLPQGAVQNIPLQQQVNQQQSAQPVQSFPSQAYAPQTFAPQALTPQVIAPQALPPQVIAPQALPPQILASQAIPQWPPTFDVNNNQVGGLNNAVYYPNWIPAPVIPQYNQEQPQIVIISRPPKQPGVGNILPGEVVNGWPTLINPQAVNVPEESEYPTGSANASEIPITAPEHTYPYNSSESAPAEISTQSQYIAPNIG